MPEVVLPAFLLAVAGLHRLSLLSTTTQLQEEFMKPVIQINFLSIKPGKIDEFIEAETRGNPGTDGMFPEPLVSNGKS
jgi:hypothetical protein